MISVLNYFEIKNNPITVKNMFNDGGYLDPVSRLINNLSVYGVKSGAIFKSNHYYSDFELPFICSIQDSTWPNPLFTFVKSTIEDQLTFVDPISKNDKTISISEFNKLDKGIILLLDGSNYQHEVNYEITKRFQNRKITKKIILITILSVFYLFNILDYNLEILSFYHLVGHLLLVLSSIGGGICLILFWSEINFRSDLLKRFCGVKNNSSSCETVLLSKGAFLFGVSLSSIGLSYFLTIIVSQLILGPSNSTYLPIWTTLSLTSLPFILYSLFYQWLIVKKWCILCVFIQAILLSMSMISISYISNFGIETGFLRSYFVIFCIGYVLYSVILKSKILLKSVYERDNYKKKWEALSYNRDIFNYLIQRETISTISTDEIEITFGGEDAKNVILMVCNPYCIPCSVAFRKLKRLVLSNSDVKLKIIFTVSNDENDVRAIPVKHFLTINEHLGPDAAVEAIEGWYSGGMKDYNIFANRFQIKYSLNLQSNKIVKMQKWCELMKIQVTPTFFVNGFSLPRQYKFDDLPHIFNELRRSDLD